jgi:Uncharacterized conserved protein
MDREHDGLRIAVTRFVPRGIRKTRYHFWMPNLAPSEPLLAAFQNKKISWKTFSQRYRQELFEPASIDKGNATIKNYGQKFTLRMLKALAKKQPITLLCTCSPDADDCHRILLKQILERKI